MNTLIQPRSLSAPQLTMDVVADFTCPWSFLGVRRVARALVSLQGLATPPLMRWHGLRLPRVPGAPAASAWREHLARRLPDNIDPAVAEEGLIEAGRDLGIQFDFGRIDCVPDTTRAHQLTLLAAREGLLAPVVDGLFRAYFEQGRDIGALEEVLGVARRVGLSALGLRALSASADADGDATLSELAREEQRLRALGVTNVPNLLLNGHVLVPGAADVDTYVLALDQALFPASTAATPMSAPHLLN